MCVCMCYAKTDAYRSLAPFVFPPFCIALRLGWVIRKKGLACLYGSALVTHEPRHWMVFVHCWL